MKPTNTLITQSYLLPDLSVQMLRFDRIRWHRSTSGRQGYYEPATATLPEPAAIHIELRTRALAGKQLLLRINGASEPTAITFEGPDPVETEQVAAAIEAETPLLVVTPDGSGLRVGTAFGGIPASIEVLPCDAAPYLGLAVGDGAVGLGADQALNAGQSEYLFNDYQSSGSTWYTVELLNSITGVSSGKSVAFRTRADLSVPASEMIGCFIRLCDLKGLPLPGRRIFIHNVFMPNRVTANGRSWGIFRQYEELVTDLTGYAEARLIRGATVDVTVAGTGFTRRIKLPSLGTIVDLLDPGLNTQDEFGIQTPTIDFAIRTTR